MLSPGTQLGAYRIEAIIGAGGMGEVYRALDSKLGRRVAIKVLPDGLSQNPERLARFERESKVLAALNHTNVASIYGLEERGNTRALILELVEGETLAERLKRGPLPVEEAVEICKQIAEALDAAHEKGIIHRDLKPGNVMVTPDGQAKVLDFGLAKALTKFPSGSEAATALSDSPTITAEHTQPGVILGTAAYMSPEQAKGKSVDKRTDIWAFGCVLYECLTGTRTFRSETLTELLAAILQSEPDWQLLPVETPRKVRELLQRCLRRDLRQRLHDIADARVELEDCVTPSDATSRDDPDACSDRSASKTRKARLALAPVLGALAGGLILGGVIIRGLTPAPESSSVSRGRIQRWNLSLPETAPVVFVGSATLGLGRPALALSPNGESLVYTARENGGTALHLRQLNQFETRAIPGTEGAYNPFFSLDGQWVGFFAGDQLKKVRISGGEPMALCEVSNPMGAAWGPDDRIVFSDAEGVVLSAVPVSGGPPVPLGAGGEWPDILPGGDVILAATRDGVINAISLDTGKTKPLVEGRYPKYASTGHLVYAQGYRGQLMAARFDLDRLELMGEPVPVLRNVRLEASRHVAQCALSTNGTLIYVPGAYVGKCEPVWVDRKGNEQALPFEADVYGTFDLSPENDRLAVQILGAEWDIWILDLTRGRSTRLTMEGNNRYPVWSPGGDRAAFYSDRAGDHRVYWKSIAGVSDAELLTGGDQVGSTRMTPYCWSSDGRFLALSTAGTPANLADIFVLQLQNDRSLVPFATRRFAEWGPTFSPDGRWLAYTSDESGRFEVYVQPYPPTGERWQITTEGGEEPLWSPKGDELFYRYGRRWMAVASKANDSFAFEAPQVLFEGDYLNVSGLSYDVATDGERFLCLKSIEARQVATQLNGIVNWFEELNRLVPLAGEEPRQ